MILSETQTTALDYLEDKTTKEVLFGGGANGGKTTLICYFGQKMSIKYPGARGLLGRSILKTLKETTLKSFWEVAKMQGVEDHFKLYDKDIIKCSNGSEILLKDLFAYPSDPDFDELGSLELTWAGIDEANQVGVKAKNILKSRVRYKLDEFKLIPKCLYVCNPAKNWVKSEFRDPSIKGDLVKTKKFVESLLRDNPHAYSGYADSLMELDEASRERLLYGNWEYSADANSLMTQDAIQAIFTNTFVKGSGVKYITADIARLGTDKIVIRVWDGWRVIERIVFSKQRTTDTAEAIRKLAAKHSIPMYRVLCDEDGVGGGVVDQLSCKGFVANSSPIKTGQVNQWNFENLKAQCGWKLADRVNANEVYEQADGTTKEMIEEELEQIKQKNVDRDGKRGLIPKEMVKAVINRSPDDSDTYLMRAWFDLAVAPGLGFIKPGFGKVSNGRTIDSM